MRRVVVIDVPLLTLQDLSASSVCLNTLDTIADKNCVLVTEDVLECLLSEAALADGELCYRWMQRLAAVQMISFSKADVFNPYISYTPDMCQGVSSAEILEAIISEMCALHVHEDCKNAVFVVYSSRWSGQTEVLITTKDHTDKQHPAILVDDNAAFSTWLEARQPKLIVEKHFDSVRLDSRGRVVSSFMAGSNKTYADGLLAKAYAEYEGDDEEPHYLYTYDSMNGCFVEFRGDRNFVYHGRDLTTAEDVATVPVRVRKIYHK